MEKVGAYTERATDSGEWRAGNPGASLTATPMLAAYFNMLQREFLALLAAADIAPDKEDETQILQAIQQLISESVPDSVVTVLNVDTALEPAQLGLVLFDAAGGNRVLTLPDADEDLGVRDVIIRRTDASGNTLNITASGADKIMFDTATTPAGVASVGLLFSGDWLHLRADGEGRWWVVGSATLPASNAVAIAGTDTRRHITAAALAARLAGPTWHVQTFTVSGTFVAPVAGTYYISGCGGGNNGGVGSTAGGGGSGGQALDFPVVLADGESVAVTIGGVGGTTTFGAYLTLTGGQAGTSTDGGDGGTGPINGVKGGYRAGANIGGSGAPGLFGVPAQQNNGIDTTTPVSSGYGVGGAGKSSGTYLSLGRPGFLRVRY